MLNALLLILNLYFAALFGVTGLTKIDQPEFFATTLRHQHIWPLWSIPALKHLFPWAEVSVSLALVTGIATTLWASVVLCLCITFLVIKLILAHTNPTVHCGCSGEIQPQGIDSASLTVSAVLVTLALVQLWATMSIPEIVPVWRLPGITIFGLCGSWLIYRILIRRYQRHQPKQRDILGK